MHSSAVGTLTPVFPDRLDDDSVQTAYSPTLVAPNCTSWPALYRAVAALDDVSHPLNEYFEVLVIEQDSEVFVVLPPFALNDIV